MPENSELKFETMADKKLVGAAELVIDKVKITHQGLNIECREIYRYSDESTAEEEIVRKYKREPHPDLTESFKALGVHLADICKCDRPSVEVKGIKIKDLNGEKPEALITGKVLTWDNGVVSINTPYMKLETTAYPHRKELNKLLIDCESEIRQYMLANKVAQPTLWEQGMKVAS